MPTRLEWRHREISQLTLLKSQPYVALSEMPHAPISIVQFIVMLSPELCCVDKSSIAKRARCLSVKVIVCATVATTPCSVRRVEVGSSSPTMGVT